MADAQYSHASLYAFDDQAQKAVIGRFSNNVNDPAAQCWYDEELQLFELKCPGALGPYADETLAETVASYITSELRNAEIFERPPNVSRFPESTFDDDDDFDDKENVTEIVLQSPSKQPLAPLLSTRKTPKSNAPTLHLIETGGASPLLRLFKLFELPDSVVKRVLTPENDAKATRAITKGLTCRAVSSSQNGKREVFNGSLGHPIPPISEEHEAALLAKAPFHTIIGDAGELPKPEPEVRQWRFKEGHEVSTKKWILGMGQTEQCDPNEPAEMPGDTRKMLAVSNQNLASGRARVPKGTLPGASDSPSDSESSDDEESNMGFNQLLAGENNTTTLDDHSSSERSDGSGTTAAGAGRGFASLLRPDAQERIRALPVSAPPVAGPQSPTPAFHVPSTPPRKPSSAPNPRLASSDSPLAIGSEIQPSVAMTSETSLHSYGPAFAGIDDIGIKANPASQAQWELDHPSPDKKRLKSGIYPAAPRSQSLTPYLSAGSAFMSLSEGPDFQPLHPLPSPSASTSTAQATVRTLPGAMRENEPSWTNRVVQPRASTRKKLIDDSAPLSRIAPVQRPPGLAAADRNHNARKIQAIDVRQREGELISVDEPDAFPGLPAPKRPADLSFKPLRPTDIVLDQTRSLPAAGSDDIVERLQDPEPDGMQKKYTMRQKAQKKGKGASMSKGKANKVELPLPDPLPVRPKKKDAKSTGGTQKPLPAPAKRGDASAHREVNTESACSSSSPTIAESRIDSDEALPSVVQENDELERLLANFSRPGGQLEVDFGLALVSHDDKSLKRPSFSATRFDSETVRVEDFVVRLTTTTGDIAHLLKFPEVLAELTAVSRYELQVRERSGTVRTIVCDSGATLISSGRDVVATAYSHFPYRVWDARYSLSVLSTNGIEDADSQLLTSLTTAGEAPSLYLRVPKDAFTLQKVYAKREYTRTLDESISLVVSEVQDLEWQAMDGATGLIHAVCYSRPEMIEMQRLWWEAKLRVDSDVDIRKVQAVAHKLIHELDGVGYGNVGPWERRVVQEEKEPPMKPYSNDNIGKW